MKFLKYKDKYHPQIKKDLKKLDKNIIKVIKEKHIDIILQKPQISEQLSGNLSGIYSYHFKHTGNNYRISYLIDEDEKIVYFLMIGKRENFYKILSRRIVK